MSTWVRSTGELRQPETNADSAKGTSPVDAWIGSRVRFTRTSRGLTQQEFSKLLDIDRKNLVACEAGAERINANLLFRIAKSLDVGPDYFFRGYVEEAPKAL
jgi:transcriptional regulator with XRE-family HTH domain